MPDASGRFRGIVVTKLWPGHPDYKPPPCKVCAPVLRGEKPYSTHSLPVHECERVPHEMAYMDRCPCGCQPPDSKESP